MKILSLCISIIALIISLIALSCSSHASAGIEFNGVLNGVFSILITLLIGWQIVSYLGFKNEIRREIEAEKTTLKEAINNVNQTITKEIKQVQNDIYKKNELYIEGIVYYIEASTLEIKGNCHISGYGCTYQIYVKAIEQFCLYGSVTKKNITSCLSRLEVIISKLDEFIKTNSSNLYYMNGLRSNINELDISNNIDFIKSKANILNSTSNNIPKELIDEFIKYEKEREILIDSYKKIIITEEAMQKEKQENNTIPT